MIVEQLCAADSWRALNWVDYRGGRLSGSSTKREIAILVSEGRERGSDFRIRMYRIQISASPSIY